MFSSKEGWNSPSENSVTMDTEYVSAETANRVTLGYLKRIFYRAKIKLGGTTLVEEPSPAHYHVTGSITPESRNVLARFLPANEPYHFVMRVHAADGRVAGYEIR